LKRWRLFHSERASLAIEDLADGTYATSDTLTYDGTTVTVGSGGFIGGFSAGGYVIGTDVNGRKYITAELGKRFGDFDFGGTSFTVAFVLSGKGISSVDRLTYGTIPIDGFNIHFAPSRIGFYPLDYMTTGLTASQFSNYTTADYCLFLVSFNQNTQKMTTMLRTNTNFSYEVTVTQRSPNPSLGYSSPSASSRTFALINENSAVSPRVYDVMIFKGEYMTEDRATYPNFGIVEDYVDTEYGIVIPF
jgi:hypothetical protein